MRKNRGQHNNSMLRYVYREKRCKGTAKMFSNI